MVVLGPFPPPVNGAAKNTLLLYEALVSSGCDAVKIDQSASSLAHRRSGAYHIERLFRNIIGLLRIAGAVRKGARLYMVPDGGLGAWYSMVHILVARVLPFEHFVIHHRTFRYVDGFSRPIAVLTRATRGRATHIFLSLEMSRAYRARYGDVDSLVAGNARFVQEEASVPAAPRAPGPLRIGHLSNLCREKGFFDVADAFEAFVATGASAELLLAGPVVEPEVAERLEGLRSRHGQAVRHCGQVSGTAKTEFYRSLDVFLFPTRYDKEASPNVVYEALAAGAPVAATGRGCLPEMIHGARGVISRSIDDFPTVATAFMSGITLDDASALRRARAIKADVAAEAVLASEQHRELLHRLGVDSPKVQCDSSTRPPPSAQSLP